MPTKGKVNKSQGQRIASTVISEDQKSFDITPDALDLRDLPNNSHLACGNCQYHGFYIILKGHKWQLGCAKCSWESAIAFPGGVLSDTFLHDVACYNKDLECMNPKCDHKIFNIIRIETVVSIGCNKCNTAMELDLAQSTLIV